MGHLGLKDLQKFGRALRPRCLWNEWAELHNANWIKAVRSLSTQQQLQEFVSLWAKMQSIALQPETHDMFQWKCTNDGQYSTKTAYNAQFAGSFCRFKTNKIWKAKVENKCKVFCWLLVLNKINTVDSLTRKGWHHNAVCVSGKKAAGYRR